MITLIRNKKGAVLITAYLVAVILLGLSGVFFSRTVHERRLTQKQDDLMRAFYNAEAGIAYAFFESASQGWTWFTHNWDTNAGDDTAQATTPKSLRTQGANADCSFIATGVDAGCYAANDGSFILKTFQDPNIADVTVVRCIGISGQEQRAIEARITRSAIFDFAWWTPKDLSLNSIGEQVWTPAGFLCVITANGGRIHSNQNITMGPPIRISGPDTISTGESGTILYRPQARNYNEERYYTPYHYDFLDGIMDGKAPLPDLELDGNNRRRWSGVSDDDLDTDKYPWQYENQQWKGGNFDSAGTRLGRKFPPIDWLSIDNSFYGSSVDAFKVRVTDSGKMLNYFNTWIYPAEKDEDCNVVFDNNDEVVLIDPEEIPAELSQAWQAGEWDKFLGRDRGDPNNFNLYGVNSDFAAQEGPVQFVVYDPDPDNRQPPTADYWNALRNTPDTMPLVSPIDGVVAAGYSYDDILDPDLGLFPYDRPTETINPLNKITGNYILDSMKQPGAWQGFLEDTGLIGRVMDGNTGGQTMEPPRFATAYKSKSENEGLYLSKKAGTYTLNYGSGEQPSYTITNDCNTEYEDDPQGYWDCIEGSIDVLVERLNTQDDGSPFPKPQRAARKVKFINTFTSETNVVLELDMGNMAIAGTFPANGIIYSQVPTRLTNAKDLPYTGDAKEATFNLICEENIYLKGNYNNPTSDIQWMPSAIISKKQIYTLSEDFNDPGWSGYDDGFTDTLSDNLAAVPALCEHPYNPFVWVKRDQDGNFIEAEVDDPEGDWKYYYEYANGSPEWNQLLAINNAIQDSWDATFSRIDEDGMDDYTVSGSGHPIIEGQTWGVMPNPVAEDQTYNCLMASYWNGTRYSIGGVAYNGIPNGQILERWGNRRKLMNGAYFQLDEEGFTALSGEGVDFVDIPTDLARRTQRIAGSRLGGAFFLNDAGVASAYDSRFRNERLAQNTPIFFGGGAQSWREIDITQF